MALRIPEGALTTFLMAHSYAAQVSVGGRIAALGCKFAHAGERVHEEAVASPRSEYAPDDRLDAQRICKV